MNILITGAKGMVGRALTHNLEALRDGKNRTRPNLSIGEIYLYDLDSTPEELEEACKKCDFVFHLAGVNRPKTPEEFMLGNFGSTSLLLQTLKKYKNKATVMLSSSIQATLAGRFGTSEYGKSKLAGEELLFAYGNETGAKVAVYRFPNLMGRSRPNYNSGVSTFCWAIANDQPYDIEFYRLVAFFECIVKIFLILPGRFIRFGNRLVLRPIQINQKQRTQYGNHHHNGENNIFLEKIHGCLNLIV